MGENSVNPELPFVLAKNTEKTLQQKIIPERMWWKKKSNSTEHCQLRSSETETMSIRKSVQELCNTQTKNVSAKPCAKSIEIFKN